MTLPALYNIFFKYTKVVLIRCIYTSRHSRRALACEALCSHAPLDATKWTRQLFSHLITRVYVPGLKGTSSVMLLKKKTHMLCYTSAVMFFSARVFHFYKAKQPTFSACLKQAA